MNEVLKDVYQYCEDVESGKILTNVYIKQAVKRFRDDFKKAESDDWPYTFDEDKAARFLTFCGILKLYKDEWRGKPMELMPWQKFIFANIYGWVKKDNHEVRRFQKAFCFVGRKAGKTHLMAATLLWDILSTPGGEAYCVATKRAQAALLLEVCIQMIKQNETLSSRLKIYPSTSRIINVNSASKIEALSADYNRFDGLNPSVVVADELSAMKSYDMIKVLQSGQGSRPSPLFFEITSGSDDIYSVGALEFERATKILEGSMEDDTFFAVLYCLDNGDDWKESNNYIKANPGLGITVKEDWLLKQRTEAIQQPSLEGEFRTKNLGQWVSPLTSWIPFKTWQSAVENAKQYSFPTDMKNCTAIGAIDLSERYDLTAYTLYFYSPETKKFYAKHKIYFPDEQIDNKMKHDSPMIRKWVEQGYMTATPGAIINYGVMFEDLKKDLEKYPIHEILFDPYNASTLINEIGPLVDLVEINQNMKNISPMAKDWEAAIINGDIVDDNPVMKWMVSNASIYKDANGNIKPVKNAANASSTKRIDCVITSLMCYGRLKQLLDDGEIDFRTPEEIMSDMTQRLTLIDY